MSERLNFFVFPKIPGTVHGGTDAGSETVSVKTVESRNGVGDYFFGFLIILSPNGFHGPNIFVVPA
jgi:hypothetical protein